MDACCEHTGFVTVSAFKVTVRIETEWGLSELKRSLSGAQKFIL